MQMLPGGLVAEKGEEGARDTEVYSSKFVAAGITTSTAPVNTPCVYIYICMYTQYKHSHVALSERNWEKIYTEPTMCVRPICWEWTAKWVHAERRGEERRIWCAGDTQSILIE